MSKLSKLRGGNAAPVALFTNDAESSVQSVFDRMLSNKPANAKPTPQKKAYTPSRFKIAQITEAEQKQGIATRTKRMVVLDDKFSFGMREHSLQGPDGKWTTERCISEWDSCALCSKDNVSVYDVAFLTVLDLTPWTKTNADGTTTEFAYTKRVLAVKKGDLAAFSGLLNVHGSFRGLVLDMTRGTAQKETASGKPTFVALLTEDELVEEFGSPEVLSENNKVIRPANDAIYPFAYERYYPVPSNMELQRKYGLAPRAGSDQEVVDNSPPFDIDDNVVYTLDLGETEDDRPLDLSTQLPDVF